MTESEWLACNDPMPMLEFLCDNGKPDEKKLRRFAAACCRRAWHRLDANGWATIEASERFADGLLTEAELMTVVWANRGLLDIDARSAIDYAAVGALRPTVSLLAAVVGRAPGADSSPTDAAAEDRERAVQADLLRCVLGPLPFRPPRVNPRWQTPLTRSLSQATYEDCVAPDPWRIGWRIFDPARLPILADALEEVGCDNKDILDHCRSPDNHVRGCWVVNLLLGKE